MKYEDVKIIQVETVYQGFYRVKCFKLQHRLFSGELSKPFERELLIRPDAVAILPYDPRRDQVVLIEQFRIGALRGKDSPWLLELVAGVIDKNKSKEEIARLETKEEAGLNIIKLIPISEYWSSPGGSCEKVTLYLGMVDASKAGGIHGLKTEHEDIKVHILSSTEAFAAVKSGRINNAATIMALQWLELNVGNL